MSRWVAALARLVLAPHGLPGAPDARAGHAGVGRRPERWGRPTRRFRPCRLTQAVRVDSPRSRSMASDEVWADTGANNRAVT